MPLRPELIVLLKDITNILQTYGQLYSSTIERVFQFLTETTTKQFQIIEPIIREQISLEDRLTREELSKNSSIQSEEEVKKGQMEVQKCQPISSPSKSINLEFYFLDYNSTAKMYNFVKISNESKGTFSKEVADLVLSYPKVHIKNITQQQLQKKISSQPRVLKPLVIPIFDDKKYVFVFQTQDYRSHQNCLESANRFMIFVTDHFIPFTLIDMVKTIVRKQYDNRFCLGQPEYALDFTLCNLKSRPLLLQDIHRYVQNPPIYHFSENKCLSQQCQKQLAQYLKKVEDYKVLVRVNTLHYKPVKLLALLAYYTIKEFKIILLGSKQNRHMMSELMIALKLVFQPMDFVYPIVFSSISEKHNNFLDSPVPCIVCYWGEERYCQKVKNKFKKCLSDQNEMPTALIDLNKLTVLNSIKTQQQVKFLQKLNGQQAESQSNQNAKNENYLSKINKFIIKLMDKSQDYEQQRQLLRKSFIYQVYMQNENK